MSETRSGESNCLPVSRFQCTSHAPLGLELSELRGARVAQTEPRNLVMRQAVVLSAGDLLGLDMSSPRNGCTGLKSQRFENLGDPVTKTNVFTLSKGWVVMCFSGTT